MAGGSSESDTSVPPTRNVIDISGNWSGQILEPDEIFGLCTVIATLSLSQNGTAISGSLNESSESGPGCPQPQVSDVPQTSSLSGTINGNQFTFTVAGDNISATVNDSGTSMSGSDIESTFSFTKI